MVAACGVWRGKQRRSVSVAWRFMCKADNSVACVRCPLCHANIGGVRNGVFENDGVWHVSEMAIAKHIWQAAAAHHMWRSVSAAKRGRRHGVTLSNVSASENIEIRRNKAMKRQS